MVVWTTPFSLNRVVRSAWQLNRQFSRFITGSIIFQFPGGSDQNYNLLTVQPTGLVLVFKTLPFAFIISREARDKIGENFFLNGPTIELLVYINLKRDKF